MKSTDDAIPPFETSEIGTPKDYSEDVYRFYFEVGEHKNNAEKIILDFLGHEKAKSIIPLSHGYALELPIQCVPDLIKQLVEENVAIYQVIRYAKTNEKWR